jgi:hypothetical protein
VISDADVRGILALTREAAEKVHSFVYALGSAAIQEKSCKEFVAESINGTSWVVIRQAVQYEKSLLEIGTAIAAAKVENQGDVEALRRLQGEIKKAISEMSVAISKTRSFRDDEVSHGYPNMEPRDWMAVQMAKNRLDDLIKAQLSAKLELERVMAQVATRPISTLETDSSLAANRGAASTRLENRVGSAPTQPSPARPASGSAPNGPGREPAEDDCSLTELFFSYSHEDEAYRLKLEKQLRVLVRQGVIRPWGFRKIGAGDDWKGQIDDHLSRAKVILLLVSPDFLASDYCYDIEMKRAMERHEARDALVIPVILRHCLWDKTPFAKLQALPTDGRPIKDWPDEDAVFADIARGIQFQVERMQGNTGKTPLIQNHKTNEDDRHSCEPKSPRESGKPPSVPRTAWNLLDEDSRVVLETLFHHFSDSSAEMDDLTRMTRLSGGQVKHAVADLVAKGLVHEGKSFGPGFTLPAYHITPQGDDLVDKHLRGKT